MLESSSLTTKCPWKGAASYYYLKVDGRTYKDAAWYCLGRKEKAQNIKDDVAFCMLCSCLSLRGSRLTIGAIRQDH
jgi:uncharacterized protein (DUF427 family)